MLDDVVGAAGRDAVVDVPILEGGIGRGIAAVPWLQVIEGSGCSVSVDQAEHRISLSSLQEDDTDPSRWFVEHGGSNRCALQSRCARLTRNNDRDSTNGKT